MVRFGRPRQAPLTWWLAISLVGFLPAPSHAQLPLRHWSFERPSYGGLTRNIADDYLVKNNGVWHLFYTNLTMPLDPVQYIGHAVSADLIEWTEHAPVLVADAAQPAWRQFDVWAPMVADRPGGGWVMAYTGVSETGSQRIGFLASDDLETWTPVSDSLPFEPDSIRYAWTATAYASGRDPHLVYQDGAWRLLYSARTVDGVPAVGYAESADLLTWTHHDPLLTQGNGWIWPDLESPGVASLGGKTYLFYSWIGCRIAQGDSLTADWANAPSTVIESFSTAPELQPSGSGLLFSRRRISPCNSYQTFLWFDSLQTTSWPFQLVPRAALPGFTVIDGNAFSAQPSFGDGQADRGETPASPMGMFWLSSRENFPEPAPPYTCGEEAGAEQVGSVRSDPFLLNGDSLAVRLGGASSTDSAYVLLRDECSGTTIVRFTGGDACLTPKSAWVGNARGRSVTWRIADRLTRPGGWIGVDNLEERASTGLGNPPSAPVVTWIAPAGGENLPRAKAFRLRWSVVGGSTLDSLILYLVDPTGESLVRSRSISPSVNNINWVTPDTLLYTARLRLVAYAHSGAWGCGTSQMFEIGAQVDADGLAMGGSLRARYDERGAWLDGRTSPALEEEAVLEVFDTRGRRVAVPWRGRESAGFHVALERGDDGRTLAPGIYFARLRQGEQIWRARIVLLRRGG